MVSRGADAGNKARIKLRRRSRCRFASAHGRCGKPAVAVESNGLDEIVVVEPRSLPAADGVALDHEQPDPTGKSGSAFEQLAKDIGLGTGFLNGRYGSVEDVGGRRAGRRDHGFELSGHTTDDFGAKLGRGCVE